MTRPTPFAALAFLLMLAIDAPAQTLYKCARPDGRTAYQDAPCGDSAKQDVVKPPPGTTSQSAQDCPTHLIPNPPVDPVTGAETAAGRKYRLALEMVVEVFKTYDGCVAEAPGFAGTFGPSYREWQQKFAPEIAAYQQNAIARRMVECAREQLARRTPDQKARDKPELAGYCTQVVGPVLQKLNLEGMRQ